MTADRPPMRVGEKVRHKDMVFSYVGWQGGLLVFRWMQDPPKKLEPRTSRLKSAPLRRAKTKAK